MSKNIVLGTVQLGLTYGVSSCRGQTNKVESEKILSYAYRKGITYLDTAPSYGSSESIIGDFICSNSSMNWNVITKTSNFKIRAIKNIHADKLLKDFELSRKKMRQENLHGLLLHGCDSLFYPGGEKLLRAMEKLKQNGVVKKIGVSLYSGDQIDCLLDNYCVDFVQLPISILDQRLIKGGKIARLKAHNVEIHARSIFLQGLLLLPIKDVPYWFNPILETLKKIHIEAKKRDISTLQLALGFVQSIDEIDALVVGVHTVEQLREIVNARSICVEQDDLSYLSINDPAYVNPSNWKI